MLLARPSQIRASSVDPEKRITLGVEQEFDLFGRRGQADFRALFRHALRGHRSIPFRNCDSAAILDAGYMLACDGREAEFATAPVGLSGDGPLRLAGEVTRCRNHMFGMLRGSDVRIVKGYSTHISVSVPRGREREIAEAFAGKVGPALILLTESRHSPGLLLRTRRGRLEIGSEYIDDERQLAAAIVFLGGAVHAYLYHAGAWERLPRLKLEHWEEANIRPGIYLPRDAYGDSMHELARTARLQTEDGAIVTAGELLGTLAALSVRELRGVVNSRALETLSDFTRRGRLLQIEGAGVPGRVTARPPRSVPPEARTIERLVRAGRGNLVPRFVDWEGAAFEWKDGGNSEILGVPWAQLPALFSAARMGKVPQVVASLGPAQPVLNSLEQLQSTQSYRQIDAVALGNQALGDKGSAGPKGGSAKNPGPDKTFEPSGMFVPVPQLQRGGTGQPGALRRLTTGGLIVVIVLLTITTIVLVSHRPRGPGPAATYTPTLTNIPPDPTVGQAQAPLTPTLVQQCVQSPSPAYPPAGAIRTGDALLRWTSASPLGTGQTFVVLAAQAPSQLTGPNTQADVVGMTTDTNLALDFSKWIYAGRSGTFYWIVRIQGADGTFLDCGGEQPLTFTAVMAVQPTRPSKEGGGGSQQPFCPPGQVCP